MNKKLLFGFMSLAALAACTNDDFDTQNGAQVSEQVSPIQFEVINNAEVMRASMNGSKIAWSAADGDLFTLYHGDCTAAGGYQNATYKAEMGDGGSAVLTTPSMILVGKAIMTWPVDTAFKQGAAALQVSVPAVQTNIENSIPYVSDVIDIAAYNPAAPYNTAGYARKYPIYMRPMASQLTIKADYAGTDAAFNALATGDDPINPIALTSIELGNTTTATAYTTNINLKFTAATGTETTRWNAAEPNNAWSDVVGFNTTAAASVQKLTAKGDCLLDGNQGCKFLILPKSVGDATSQVVVNTIYGKVVIGAGSSYAGTEPNDAWYRYISAATAAAAGETKAPTAETSGDNAGKYKTTANIQAGMTQTFSAIDANVAPATDKYVAGEQMGGAVTRYVKVLLNYIDMNDLHIKNDKHLYDAVRVWKEIGTGNVTVRLDGDATTGEFEISQKTITKINEINAAVTGRKFNVTACADPGEVCNTIVITGGGAVQNMDFIVNTVAAADVALKAGETWEWAASETAAKTLTLSPVATNGVKSIINKGTFVSGATATLAIYDNAAPTPAQMNVKFVNDGTWNVNAGDVTVQFDVTNNGIVNIKKGAEYHQDITAGTTATTFENDAQTLEERFFMNDPSKTPAQKAAFVEKIGVVNNSGVFAVTGNTTVKGVINNYSLIEHADKDAKTYITANELGGNYATAWGAANKLGRINLPFSNKDEDNISISKALTEGFVSVTVSTGDGAPTDGKLNASVVGDKVNYVIIKSGVTAITEMSNKIKYVEFNDDNDTEIAWQAGTSAAPVTATYNGLIVLSPVNIKLYTTVVVNNGTYLGAKMYVGGTFTNGTGYSAYYGNTTANETSMYITY